MKKILFFASVFSASLGLNAQLTQANHALAIADSYKMYQCDSLNINPGASGAGALWNFTSITTHSSILSTFVAGSSNTLFPSANIAVASTTIDNAHYNSGAGAWLYYGGNISVSPVAAVLVYTTPAVSAVYPMSLNTTSSSVTGGSINVSAPTVASGTFVGNSTTIADGTGTLNLPGGLTYTNVTRIVTSQTISFNILVTVTVTQKNYEYYQPNIKGPLFAIRTATFSSSLGSPSTQTFVTRVKGVPTNTSTIGFNKLEAVEALNLSVYPNPAKNNVNFITNSTKAAKVCLYDVTGKLVEKYNLFEGKLNVDLTSFYKGLYIYTLLTEDGTKLKSGKITVGE
jgi:Secretion system C-terminal sorting domain